MDILAFRVKTGSITGEILVNGKRMDKQSYQRICGYVFQDDNLMGTLTVRECIEFSANLRLPDAIDKEEKARRVEQVLRDLGISHIADRKIGDELNRGISGGEKRRVSIGMELVTSPHVLYLDEPTSGLDSASAYSVIQSIVHLAKQGRTIVFSIHQPRSNIFTQFDEIILMRYGRIVYSGRADQASNYFKKYGYECPNTSNPADYLIDVLARKDLSQEFLDAHSNYLDSENPTYYQQQREVISEQTEQFGEYLEGKMLPKATSFYSQLLILSGRAMKNFYRNEYLMKAHYLSAIAMGLVLGFVFYQLGVNLDACQNRMGSIYFMCCLLCFAAMSSLELFITERSIFVRERANGYYHPSAYFISKAVFDIIPLRVVPPLLMGSIAYYMIGLRHEFTHFLWFLLLTVLFNVVSGGMCLCIGAIAPSVASANLMATLGILGSSLFGGFLLNLGAIPKTLVWLKYLSFWKYAYEALLINELYGLPIIVDPTGMPSFPADGNFLLVELEMDYNRFYIDVIVLTIFAIAFMLLAAILMKVCVREKR
jgi:ABC-type multidrug transport system ATPase subunit/ABC-type multidrug transport system permease subunit